MDVSTVFDRILPIPGRVDTVTFTDEGIVVATGRGPVPGYPASSKT